MANVLVHATSKHSNKVPREKRDVFLALSKRRKRDREYVEPVKQVRPETTLPHHLG
jgi:hypothetical protein